MKHGANILTHRTRAQRRGEEFGGISSYESGVYDR